MLMMWPCGVMRISKLLTPRGVPPRSGLGSVTGVPVRPESRSALLMRGGERAVDHAMVLMQLNMPITCEDPNGVGHA